MIIAFDKNGNFNRFQSKRPESVKMGVEKYDRYYLKLPHMKLLNMRSSSIFVRIKCRQSLTYFDIIKSTAKNKFILLTSILKTSLFQVEIRNKPRTNIGTWRSILGMTPERLNRKLIHLKFIDWKVKTFHF